MNLTGGPKKWIEGGPLRRFAPGRGSRREGAGARWRTPWSAPAPGRWTVAQRQSKARCEACGPERESAEAREGSEWIPRRAEPEEKKRRARPPGVVDGGGHARDVPRFREGRASEALSSTMPSPSSDRESQAAGRSQRVLNSTPVLGSGHGFAEVSQDSETQGLAAKAARCSELSQRAGSGA